MWTELRTPDRLKIPMVDSQVVGQLGEAGIDGWIDTHFWERFGNAMMLSTVQDVAAAAASSAPSKDRNTDYTENSRAAAAEMAKTALDNSINIPPTIYKNQGDIIGIMGGWIIGVQALGFNSATYLANSWAYLENWDVVSGLIKGAAFGLIVALSGCWFGMRAGGGAAGVGRATTNAVVAASVGILAANFALTGLFF